MIDKIALGTVQFGLDYGISNKSGQVSLPEIAAILSICREAGIDILDTAHAYGSSEVQLGNAGFKDFKIISKLPVTSKYNVSNFFLESLKRLNKKSIYGYMLHNFSIYENDKYTWTELMGLRQQGKVQKIGVSLYSPEHLIKLWEDGVELDIIQVPFNLFDHRFKPYLSEMKERGIEIHTRSTFLQGLFFKSPENLPPFLQGAKKELIIFNQLVKDLGLTKVQACLGWVLSNSEIDKVVIGVDSSEQLQRNIDDLKRIQNKKIDWSLLDRLRIDDLIIINPSNWV